MRYTGRAPGCDAPSHTDADRLDDRRRDGRHVRRARRGGGGRWWRGRSRLLLAANVGCSDMMSSDRDRLQREHYGLPPADADARRAAVLALLGSLAVGSTSAVLLWGWVGGA